ncbi:MAG: hypothetical protein D3903_09480 [Candidatus Electrothrix sp. GM3_4]|nr:hypothetical protein [Candidatus Electrothrix sp. GM3_4]
MEEQVINRLLITLFITDNIFYCGRGENIAPLPLGKCFDVQKIGGGITGGEAKRNRVMREAWPR